MSTAFLKILVEWWRALMRRGPPAGIMGSETGVWWAIVIAEVTAGAVAIALFRRGKWKEVRV